MAEMNTTPLIDVLLVLLIMLIVTIPAATHAVKFDLPAGAVPNQPVRASNLLVVKADGSLRWNGEAVSGDQLRSLLAATSQMDPAPELHLRPEPDARHGDVDRLLVLIRQEQVRKFGFVGNEQYLHVF
jgi:biopolymer transport protein ExbD